MTTKADVQRMRVRVVELAQQDSLILDEDDREFILGLKMLMEMGEPLEMRYVPRVDSIYEKTMQNAFAV